VKSELPIPVITAGLIVLATALARAVPATAGPVVSLRGAAAPPTTTAVPAAVEPAKPNGRFARSYRQQPPLIPHDIASYRITRANNPCLLCHGPAVYKATGAPKIGDSHLFDRQGKPLDHVARSRWFCNQCHVPQMNARPLVSNDFRGETAKP